MKNITMSKENTKQVEFESCDYGKCFFTNKVDFFEDISQSKFDNILISNDIPAVDRAGYSVLFSANLDTVTLSPNQKVITFEKRTRDGFCASVDIQDEFTATKYYISPLNPTAYYIEVCYMLEIESCPIPVKIYCTKINSDISDN